MRQFNTELVAVECVAVAVLFLGCASMVGNLATSALVGESKVHFPQPTQGFAPKKAYTTAYDSLWTQAVKAISANQIFMAQTDRESGLIATDWIQGETQGKGIYGAISTRYKYNLVFRRVGAGNVALDIASRLESKSIDDKLDWHDVSAHNEQLLTSLNYWLYEQIERASGQTASR